MEVPEQLRRSWGRTRPEWLAALPRLTADALDRWDLRPEGPQWNGMAGLVLPVTRAGGTPAVLKLQPLTAESAGVAAGLRAWAGDGIVRLLEHDPATGAQLLERLDHTRPLSAVPRIGVALDVLAGLLARLTAHPAPPGLRHLGGEREPWLAIDPEPLAGDPGFDLLPALDNRWDDAVATGDVARAVRYRFDLLTEAAGLDRQRAAAWSLARVLQNSLWEIADGGERLDPVQCALGQILLVCRGETF